MNKFTWKFNVILKVLYLFQGIYDPKRGAPEPDGEGHRLHSLEVDQHQGRGTR